MISVRFTSLRKPFTTGIADFFGALAAQIYADAYSQNAEFYSFLRSMDAYEQSFNSKQDILVVEPDSEFFRFMNSKSGRSDN